MPCSIAAGRTPAVTTDTQRCCWGAVKHLAETDFAGTIYFHPQSAKENEAGGRLMIQEGVLDRYRRGGLWHAHWPELPVGQFAICPGPMMAALILEIFIKGLGGDGAMPHLAVDPIVASGASYWVRLAEGVLAKE